MLLVFIPHVHVVYADILTCTHNQAIAHARAHFSLSHTDSIEPQPLEAHNNLREVDVHTVISFPSGLENNVGREFHILAQARTPSLVSRFSLKAFAS